MPIARTTAALAVALLAACASVDRAGAGAGAPPAPEPTVAGGPELGRIRCLVVAPFENTSDLPRLGDVASSALVASLDPELTRVFPVDDLARVLRGTSLELPPEGVSPRLAVALAEKAGADGVLYGSVEGRAEGSTTGLVVAVRLQETSRRELVFANVATVRPEPGEQVEVALRKALLLAARPMLLRIGSRTERSCFDPELVRRARVARAAPARTATAAPEPPALESVPPPPPPPAPGLPAPPAPSGPGAALPALAAPLASKDPRAARPAELARKLDEGARFVLEDVEFAGRTAVLVRDQGLGDLARALAALPAASVRLEVFVDATDDASADARASMAQAMAVVRRLVALGVARDRIAQEARGGEAPRLPNFTSRGRAANRRIEVVTVKAR